MNAGDVKAGRPSSEEAWLSASAADPNAALWASITPPPSPTLVTSIRRRVATFSPDLLAQRLHLAFPRHFSSRVAAGRALLGAAAALGAGAGLVAYLVAGSFSGAGANAGGAAEGARAARHAVEEAAEAGGERKGEPVERNAATGRAGQTALSDEPTQALANTAALASEDLVQAQQPSADLEEAPKRPSKVSKRAHTRKKVKARARPRARSAVLEAEERPSERAAAPERPATPERARAPQRAKPRRQATFKFN